MSELTNCRLCGTLLSKHAMVCTSCGEPEFRPHRVESERIERYEEWKECFECNGSGGQHLIIHSFQGIKSKIWRPERNGTNRDSNRKCTGCNGTGGEMVRRSRTIPSRVVYLD